MVFVPFAQRLNTFVIPVEVEGMSAGGAAGV